MGGWVGALVQGSRSASGEQEAHVFRVVTSGSTCVPQLNVARCGEPSSGGVARRALTNVGLRRCWLLGDSRRGRLLGVGEGVFTRRLGEARFSDGVGEGVARGPGEVRFNSSVGVDGREPKAVGVDGREPKVVGVDGREPKVRVAPDRSPTVPRPAAPEPASVWSAWRKQTIAEAGQALATARPWCGLRVRARVIPLIPTPFSLGVLMCCGSRLARGGHLDGHIPSTARHCTLTSSSRDLRAQKRQPQVRPHVLCVLGRLAKLARTQSGGGGKRVVKAAEGECAGGRNHIQLSLRGRSRIPLSPPPPVPTHTRTRHPRACVCRER